MEKQRNEVEMNEYMFGNMFGLLKKLERHWTEMLSRFKVNDEQWLDKVKETSKAEFFFTKIDQKPQKIEFSWETFFTISN